MTTMTSTAINEAQAINMRILADDITRYMTISKGAKFDLLHGNKVEKDYSSG